LEATAEAVAHQLKRWPPRKNKWGFIVASFFAGCEQPSWPLIARGQQALRICYNVSYVLAHLTVHNREIDCLMRHRLLKLGFFGSLSLLLLTSSPRLFSAPAKAFHDSAFGLNSQLATRYDPPETLAAPASVVTESNTGWVREDFPMNRILKYPRSPDWNTHDRMVDLFIAEGLNVIGVLNGPTPDWSVPAKPADDFYPPNDPDAFSDFASQVVTHYRGRVKYWEIWNRPSDPLYWKPQPNVAAYAELLKRASAAIKAADPEAQVLVGGMIAPEPAVSFLRELAANGAWNAFDILSVQPYIDPLAPERGIEDGLEAVKALASRFGSKPLWVTEYGWATGPSQHTPQFLTEDEQANYLVRGAALLRAAGAERVIWYTLKDFGSTDLYGLVRTGNGASDYSPTQLKPAYRGFKTLNTQLQGTVPVEMLDLGPKSMLLNSDTLANWHLYADGRASGRLLPSNEQSFSDGSAAKLTYDFPTNNNEYLILENNPLPLPSATYRLGLWVYGDGSGHSLKVQIRDAQGEKLQYQLGYIGPAGWQFVAGSITGEVWPGNVIEGQGNRQIDFPAQLEGIILDDEPNAAVGKINGVIFLDDLTAFAGSEAYGVRFKKANGVVDLVWSPGGAPITLYTQSVQGQRVELWGDEKVETAQDNAFTFNVGPNPIFFSHLPGLPPTPTPTQTPTPTFTPTPTTTSLPTETPTNTPTPSATSPATPTSLTTPTYTPEPLPTTEPTGELSCFEVTHLCTFGRIRDYWDENGGLMVFGYPIGPQRRETIEGKTLQVQWFERNRLELHPENEAPYDVLLGRLGADSLAQKKRKWEKFPKSMAQEGCRFFPETGHNICGEFLEKWHAEGLEIDGQPGFTEGENLALFGLPLSDPMKEILEEKDYTVQWFERARFELHPENEPPFKVLLGLLGNEVYQKK